MTQGFWGTALIFTDLLYAGHEDIFMHENDLQAGCKVDLLACFQRGWEIQDLVMLTIF